MLSQDKDPGKFDEIEMEDKPTLVYEGLESRSPEDESNILIRVNLGFTKLSTWVVFKQQTQN